MIAAVPLFPYQSDYLGDKSRFKGGMFARQTGKTFTSTLELTLDCFDAAVNGHATDWVILSSGERQAKEAMYKGVQKHAKAMDHGLSLVDGEYKSTSGVTYKSYECTFPGGSRVLAIPANPDTARGLSANVFLDEYSVHKDQREIWGALFPVISNGYKIRVTGTPKGKSGKFYELMSGSNPQWSIHRVDIHRAVADGLPRDIEELKAGLNDEDLWRQEFLIEWLDEADAWLSYDLIISCEDEDAGIPESYQGGPVFIGNDIGRHNDLWVAWAWELVGDIFWCREVRTLKRQPFHVQDEHLDEMMKYYGPHRVSMDKTSIGEKPVEDAQRRYGSSIVEGVNFTSQSKDYMAQLLKRAFQDRRVRIPVSDAVRGDLHRVKKVALPGGGVRYDAERDAKGHADRFWSAALGLYGAINPYQTVSYKTVGAPQDYSGGRLVSATRGFSRRGAW